MKGLGPILIWLFISALAAMPLAIFSSGTKPGKLVRLCSGLVCILCAYQFLSQLGSDRKSPSPLWFMVGIPYFYAFLAQVFRRKGIPLIETLVGLLAFVMLQELSDKGVYSAAAAMVAVSLVYLATAKLAPIRNVGE